MFSIQVRWRNSAELLKSEFTFSFDEVFWKEMLKIFLLFFYFLSQNQKALTEVMQSFTQRQKNWFQVKFSQYHVSLVVMHRSNRIFKLNPHPWANPEHLIFWRLGDWNSRPHLAKMVFLKMPYPIVGFVCQLPLLKNNRWFLSSVIKLVYIRGTRIYRSFSRRKTKI